MKTKTLFLASQLEGHGGIQRFNKNIIKSLENDTIDLDILSLNDKSDKKIIGFNKSRFKLILHLFKIIIFSRYDVFIIGHLNFAIFSIFKLFKPKMCIITIIHGVEAWKENKKHSYFYKKIDFFWAVSSYTKNTFSKLNTIPQQKMKQIFNTIPLQWSNNSIETKMDNYFFTVTRLDKNEKYKGIDKTLEAIKNLKEFLINENFTFLAVLSGNDKERHENLISEYGIESLVKFKSNIDDSTLLNYYKNCSFFILPSDGEGFGIVFLEAMQLKKACIGSINCGTEDVIDDNITGYLIEPTVANIQEKIKTLIKDKNLCKEMGEKGYNKLHREFIFNKFEERINKLTTECAG